MEFKMKLFMEYMFNSNNLWIKKTITYLLAKRQQKLLKIALWFSSCLSTAFVSSPIDRLSEKKN